MNFADYLEKRSKRFIVAVGALLALMVGIPDYLLGTGFGFSIFYLIPITLTTWYAGRRAGVCIAGVSATIWFVAEKFAVPALPHTFMPLWNAVVRLAFFVIVVVLLNAVKREKSFAREDYLTGLGNRRYFFELAEAEMNRSARYGHPFTLAYIDADDFKSVNDRFGHAEGDSLLKATADAIQSTARATDIAARLGGDEFAVLLPESGREAASAFFNKLHQKLSEVMEKENWPVTFSIGVVTFIKPPVSIDAMIKIVDHIMYSAKSGGKNRVQYGTFE